MLISGKGKYFHVFGCISKNFPENIFWCLEKKKENTNPEKHKPQPRKKSSTTTNPVRRPRRRSRSEIAISDRDHGAVVVDDFMYFLGCGLCFLICVFLLLFQTPNTRKYFSENFLKCNQTHGNIFLFRKTFYSNQTQP